MTPKSYRTASLPYLTKLAHGSTPFIATFLLVHLSAPALATLGGSTLSSQIMLLGREIYQTPFNEPYLLLAPLVLHPISATLKRVLSPPSSPPRPKSSLLTIAGYATCLVFLPLHFLTHRVDPITPTAPIHALGPSELDFEFVKYGLRVFPWRSWVLYAGLVGCVAVHATEGVAVMWNLWGRGKLGAGKGASGRRRKRLGIAVGAVVVPVLMGVWALSREPGMVFPDMALRFAAVYKRSFVYR